MVRGEDATRNPRKDVTYTRPDPLVPYARPSNGDSPRLTRCLVDELAATAD